MNITTALFNTCKVLHDSIQEQQSQRPNFLFQLSVSLQVLTESMIHPPALKFLLQNRDLSKLQRNLTMVPTHLGISCAKISQTTFFPQHEMMKSLQGITSPLTQARIKNGTTNPYFDRASNVVPALGVGSHPLLLPFNSAV